LKEGIGDILRAAEIRRRGVAEVIGRERDGLVAACRRAVEDRFSIPVMCAAYVKAYEGEMIRSTPSTASAKAWG